jgi:DNA-binding IclR family transcriptional regulator
VATSDRLLAVLALFTPQEPEWRIDTAAARLNISSSTAYRYFNSLCRAGLIETMSTGIYVLGPAIIAYDLQIRRADPLLKVARPVLQRLVELSDNKAIALLCRRYREQVMCVHQEYAGSIPPQVSYERGRLMSLLRGAASRVILANMPAHTLRAIHKQKGGEIAVAELGRNWDEFKTAIKQMRSAGFQITRGQLDVGRVGVAAPLFFPKNVVIGSVSIVLHEADATPNMLARMSSLVVAMGKEIEAAMEETSPSEPSGVETSPSVDSKTHDGAPTALPPG